MQPLLVRDIMTPTPDVATLWATASLAEAAARLTGAEVSGCPVFDQGRIVGVVSKSDLVRGMASGMTGAHTVRDVMTPAVHAVRAGDPALAAARLMVDEGIHRAIVVGSGGELGGIVTSMDVLRALVRAEPQANLFADPGMERHAEPAMAVAYVDLRELEVGTRGGEPAGGARDRP